MNNYLFLIQYAQGVRWVETYRLVEAENEKLALDKARKYAVENFSKNASASLLKTVK